jgi:hypothetical protein
MNCGGGSVTSRIGRVPEGTVHLQERRHKVYPGTDHEDAGIPEMHHCEDCAGKGPRASSREQEGALQSKVPPYLSKKNQPAG